MPEASEDLRRLRSRTGIKSGRWAESVQMNRTAYIAVENGRRPGSIELFARCATLLTELLGVDVDAQDLIADERKLDREPKRESEHVSPTPLEPARPADEPTHPPSKPDSASAA